MIKYFLVILFSGILMYKNKISSFYYNLYFFLRILLLIRICNNNLWFRIRIYIRINYYSYILIILIFWILRLILITLKNNMDSSKKLIFWVILVILFIFFSVKNIFLFYIIFELRLIPTFFIVVYWGYNPERLRAALFILIYTMLISLPLLLFIILIYKENNTYDLYLLKNEGMEIRFWSYLILIGAFFVKMPIYLFHIWLPKAHVEAPVYGSIVLAAILLKLGRYGLIQFLIIFLKSYKFSNVTIRIRIFGSLLVRLICLVQIDIKRLVAYSSVVHINILLCRIITIRKIGFLRAYIIILAHGLCSSGLFYAVNLYYSRSSRRLILLNKGIINLIPLFTLWWFILCSSNFSFPLSIRFIREIMMIGVILKWRYFLIIYIILVRFFRRAYSLYLYRYVQHGEIRVVIDKFDRGIFKEILVIKLHYLPLALLLLNINLLN